MRTIHIGHHFFGAGNQGDDWMMAGFLSAVPKAEPFRLTCCVPYALPPLRSRFPEVEWLPYDETSRRQAIDECSVWLGLGGSPFQTAGSRWFIDHLAEEARWCAAADKPMYYLGIGGQDPAAYALPEIQAVLAQGRGIWTRDARTAAAIEQSGPAAPVQVGADLAHLYFQTGAVPAAVPGRLTAVLNFDYEDRPRALAPLIAALGPIGATERIWAVQEERPLPGAEHALYEQLAPAERDGWQIRQEPLARWPSGEWLLSSRYHATLAGAWAGSKAVVIALNEKLRAAADETGFPVFELEDDPGRLPRLFERSQRVNRSVLEAQAELAAKACGEFWWRALSQRA